MIQGKYKNVTEYHESAATCLYQHIIQYTGFGFCNDSQSPNDSKTVLKIFCEHLLQSNQR